MLCDERWQASRLGSYLYMGVLSRGSSFIFFFCRNKAIKLEIGKSMYIPYISMVYSWYIPLPDCTLYIFWEVSPHSETEPFCILEIIIKGIHAFEVIKTWFYVEIMFLEYTWYISGMFVAKVYIWYIPGILNYIPSKLSSASRCAYRYEIVTWFIDSIWLSSNQQSLQHKLLRTFSEQDYVKWKQFTQV